MGLVGSTPYYLMASQQGERNGRPHIIPAPVALPVKFALMHLIIRRQRASALELVTPELAAKARHRAARGKSDLRPVNPWLLLASRFFKILHR
jgi:hypothetical protein